MRKAAIATLTAATVLLASSACDSDAPNGDETATLQPSATLTPATATKGPPTVAPEEFVTPDAASLEGLLVSGCDPAWIRDDFEEVRVSVCYPQGWTTEVPIEQRLMIQFPSGGLNIQPDNDSLDCKSSATFDTDIGNVGVCAFHPLEGGQSHQLLLPNGVSVFVFVLDDAGSDERADAFRVAMSVERLP